MKILHTSDWHLGQNFIGKSRQEEHLAFLNWLIEIIKERKITTLLVSGDIFDTGSPPNYALELYFNFLKQLSQITTLKKTIITAGNHDSISTLKASRELLKLLNISIITTGDKEDIIIPIEEKGELKAIICAIPFLRDTIIRNSLPKSTSSKRDELYTKGIKEFYKRAYQKASILRGDKNIPIVAMGHLTMVGSFRSESEREIYIGGEVDIGGEYLETLFDYVALGHLHKNQKVKSDKVRYSGSPIPLSFSEAKEIKRVNIISFNGKEATIKELEIPKRRELLIVKGDGESILKELREIKDREAWIKIELNDENSSFYAQKIREEGIKLKLNILMIKNENKEYALKNRDKNFITLEELKPIDVFKKRVEFEEIKDRELKEKLILSFSKIVNDIN